MNAHTFCCDQVEVSGRMFNDVRKELTAALLEQIREFIDQNPSLVTYPDFKIGNEATVGDLVISVALPGFRAYFVKLGTYWDQVDMPLRYKRGPERWTAEIARGVACRAHRFVSWEVSIGFL